ncbi:MAG: hypothetical protein J2P28_22475, partial [Actinobacteria bacterium]|nr:hypothetical protein [Actinomycetota bacterium]
MRSAVLVLLVEVAVRWRRDDRQPPDDRRDDDEAADWLSEFRGQSVRPESLTAADRDAAGRQAAQVGSRPTPGEPAEPRPGGAEQRGRTP